MYANTVKCTSHRFFGHAKLSSPCITWSFQQDIAFINVFHGIFFLAFIDKKVLHSFFFFNKNVVFPVQAEYPYFSADFRLKIFL